MTAPAAPAVIEARWKGIVRNVARTFLELLGLGLLAYGARMAWKPAGYMVPGAIILTIGIWTELRE
jgi:hypothetical protein